MITVTLPDKSTRTYPDAVTGEAIAESISKSLAKDAVAIKVDGALKDIYLPLKGDAAIEIVTAKHPDGLELIRHDTAHLMAQAVKELFPDTQVTIGPAIEHGFYYDFARDKPFSTDDLATIEAKMRELSQKAIPIRREVWERDKAVAYFKSIGEAYKAEIISDLPKDETISVYRQGEFLDLCLGPHAPSTAFVKHFKLMKVAGAYWRGDHRNAQLQRIYGTAWANEKDLKAYLTMLEEAEKRDHRKLGPQLGLFHIQEEATGMVFWHDKGWTLYRALEDYIRRQIRKRDYIEVRTPILVDRSLWEASGHWEKFHENMFISGSEDKTLAIKPMNCPCHVQIFNQGTKSYRDLPLRMSEFGTCHRNESSGSLHGIMRLRGFVQDDAHIFCTPNQITSETIAFCDLLKEVYKDLGFTEIAVKFSDRPAKRAGSDEVWDKAEAALKEAVTAAGLEYTLNPGEGAFYGPKLEFVLRDAIGRDWQCGTLQVDFVLPDRLNANYIAEDGQKHRPVMLHRAVLGSIERFIGILIENYEGKFPLWLAPVQMVVAPITNDFDGYANEVASAFRSAGLRVETDLRAEKINYKVREHSVHKIPLIVAVGGREAEQKTIALRRLGSEKQEVLPLDEAVKKLAQEAMPPA